MNCFLFYSIFFYLSYVLANEFDLICPTPRRLLLVNRVPSGSIDEKKSSPPKYARSGIHEPSSSVFIRPKASHEHKERSYTHLLKTKDKKTHEHRNKSSGSKKKKHSEKKVNVTATATTAVKTRGLVAVKSNELERCRALLHIDSIPTPAPSPSSTTTTTSTAKTEKIKPESPKKVKEPNEKKSKDKNLPVEEKSATKKNKGVKQSNEESRAEESTRSPPIKTKREKSSTTTTTTTVSPPVVADEDDILPNDDLSSSSNHSMVNRAIHFVKNIFQLSDDVLEIPVTPKIPSIPHPPDQDDIEENIHRSRKLLSIDEDHYHAVHFSSRRLLATKSSEKKSSSKKSKSKTTTTTSTTDQTKPKVGWAYRYRISRYLAAQKMQQSRKKPIENKIAKRKSHRQNRNSSIDDDDLHHVITFTKQSPSQRHLSHTKRKDDSTDERRSRLKSFDHLTDPIAIVRAYEEHGYKPRVGWQYRYRVSAYIEALRNEIRQGRTRNKIQEKSKKTKSIHRDQPLSQIHSPKRKEEKKTGIPLDLDRKKSKKDKNSDSNKSSKKKEEKSESSSSKISQIHSSSSFFAPLVKKSFCSLPFASCQTDESVSTEKKSLKKLRTRKEPRAKQFIRTRATKLGAEDKYTERRIDERMQELYQNPSYPPPQAPPAPPRRVTTKTTTAMPRLRTISEVIREEADTFFMNKPSDFRSNEDLHEENDEQRKEFVPKKKSVRNHSRTHESVSDQNDFKTKTNKN